MVGLANPTPEGVIDLGRRYGALIGAEPGCWESERDSRDATLVWLADVAEFDAAPGCEELPRCGRRHGWLTLD